MNIILLSGGSGKRLWPLSNDIRSKQFIKIFKKSNGEYESMIQKVFRQIQKADKEATITIATSKTQVSAIRNQLKKSVNICVEPCRKDTFPAITLATLYLNEIIGISEDETVVVCPVDPFVEEDYFQALKKLDCIAKKSEAYLTLLGMEPTCPSDKYGYIIPKDKEKISAVKMFKEKPDLASAEKYINQGALWNGGVFAYKIKYIIKRAHEIINFTNYEDLFQKYSELEKISFDYAIAEKEKNIQVMRFNGKWKDIGTWDTLVEAMEEKNIGNVLCDESCNNVNVINELAVPVLCVGMRDVIVSASPEGILVSDKEKSGTIKPFVDQIKQQIMFAEKSWGNFQVIDVEKDSMTVKISLKSGHSMNYHSHERRDEVWTIISGNGKTIVDGMEQLISAGDVITMQSGCRHTIMAETELKIIEIQLGKEISVDDKKKFKPEW